MAVLNVIPYIDIVVVLCLHLLVLWDGRVQLLFGNRIALNPGLGCMGMSHLPLSLMNRLNQIESLDAVFPRDLFSDYLFHMRFMRSLEPKLPSTDQTG